MLPGLQWNWTRAPGLWCWRNQRFDLFFVGSQKHHSWIKYLVQTAVALSGTSLCELGHRNGKHRRGAPVVGWLSTGWCRSLVGGAETWLINCWLMVNDCQCCSNLVVNGSFFFGCFFRDGYNCIHSYQFVSISHLNPRASCIVQDGSAAAKIKPRDEPRNIGKTMPKCCCCANWTYGGREH